MVNSACFGVFIVCTVKKVAEIFPRNQILNVREHEFIQNKKLRRHWSDVTTMDDVRFINHCFSTHQVVPLKK